MGKKQNRSIEVDLDKYNKVKDVYSVAKLLDGVFDEVLSDETQDVTLAIQLGQIDQAIVETRAVRAQAEISLKGAIERIAYLEDRKVRLKEEFDQAKDIALLSRYYSQFNAICINSDWDINTIYKRGAELIGKIKLVDPSFDAEKRMKRYKMLMDDY
jgi:hypothetical protein